MRSLPASLHRLPTAFFTVAAAAVLLCASAERLYAADEQPVPPAVQPLTPPAQTAPAGTAAGTAITVKGMLYSGKELIPGAELVVIGGKTSVQIAGLYGILTKTYRDNRDGRKKFNALKSAWDNERRQTTATFVQQTTTVTTIVNGVPTTTTIPTGPSLRDVLAMVDAKYQPQLDQCQAEAKAALEQFYQTFRDMTKDLKSPILGAGGNPDVILLKTDSGGKFTLTVPTIGRYYVVVLAPVTSKRTNITNYIITTADIVAATKELVIRTNDFTFE